MKIIIINITFKRIVNRSFSDNSSSRMFRNILLKPANGTLETFFTLPSKNVTGFSSPGFQIDDSLKLFTVWIWIIALSSASSSYIAKVGFYHCVRIRFSLQTILRLRSVLTFKILVSQFPSLLGPLLELVGFLDCTYLLKILRTLPRLL